MSRRTYDVNIVVNGQSINEVVIDPHYENKHPDISDAIILALVKKLDGKEYIAEMKKDGFEFYMLDGLPLDRKKYRLVWCMQDGAMFIGVINAFRSKS